MGSHKALWIHKVWGSTRHHLQFCFFCFNHTASQQSNSDCQFQSALLCLNYSQGARSAFETPLPSAEWSHWSVTSSRRRILCQSVPLKSSVFSPLLPRSQRASKPWKQARRKGLCLAHAMPGQPCVSSGHKEGKGGKRTLVLAGHEFAELKRK